MVSSRLAASSAELQGNSRVMYESCPIDNNLPDSQEPSTIQVKGVHNRVMVGGVTDFNNYLKLSYENFAGRKAFNDYTARVITLLSGGVRASRIAVYYPIETMWTKWKPADMRLYTWFSVTGADPEASVVERLFNNTSNCLLNYGWEFSYIDAQGLVESKVNGQKLCHGDELKWDVIILPGVETLPKQAYDRLVEFVQNGGKVIALNKLPVNSESQFPSEEITNMFQSFVNKSQITYNDVFSSSQLNTQLEGLLDRDIILDSYSGVMYSHKRINGKDVYFIINDTEADKSVTISLPTGVTWELWNPQTGEILPTSSTFTRNFGACEGIILRSSDLVQSTTFPKKESLRMYPNPTTGLLNIDVPMQTVNNVKVINMVGKIERNFADASSQIDISGLNAGFYLVQINTNEKVFTKMIQKI